MEHETFCTVLCPVGCTERDRYGSLQCFLLFLICDGDKPYVVHNLQELGALGKRYEFITCHSDMSSNIDGSGLTKRILCK